MSRPSFLADRFVYIVLYVLSTALVVLVVQLDLRQSGHSLRSGNVLYLALLSLLALVGVLAWDYARQRSFGQQVLRISEGKSTCLEDTLTLQGAVTREQECFQEVLREQYRLYVAELADYRSKQELREYFIQRFVHQMKTPIAVMDLMLQQHEGDMRSDIIKDLREEKDKLSTGLSMLLHQSRLERFSLDLVIRQEDLLAVVRDVLNQLKSSFIRSKVYPQVLSPTERVMVQTDAKWLSFAVEQLLTNAIKYSRVQGDESKQLTLRLIRQADAWTLMVRDEGIGIVPEDLGRIFQPFFTGQNGRLFPEATGMGLYFVAEICRHLGHGIDVESLPGEGTTFSLKFFDGETLHNNTTT